MTDGVAAMLREIHDQQRLQIERQPETPTLLCEQLGHGRQRFDRLARGKERAEAIRRRAGRATRIVAPGASPLPLVLFQLLRSPCLRHLSA